MNMPKTLNIFIGFLFLICGVAHGATINVPGDYSTIQEGLDAASDGDIVSVADGTYTENIVWPQTDNITLASVNGPAGTVIDGSGDEESCIYVGNGQTGVKIDGFTIQNGYGSLSTFHGSIKYGGGILIDEDVTATITNCHIINNGRDEGEYSGGIFVSQNSDVTIESCIVADNDAHGIYFRNFSSNSVVRNCLIINNGVAAPIDNPWHGAGIYCQSSPIQIYNNTIAINTGPGLLFYTPWPTLKNNIISENDGYAIFSDDTSSDDIITHNNLWNNGLGDHLEVNGPTDGIFLVGTNGNVSSDPLFVGGVPFDYHLSQNSPCLDVGTSGGAPDNDIDGDARPSGAGFDIGADEFAADAVPKNSGSCFIATAAYGSFWEPQVLTLRQFRDSYLLTNNLGTKFVEAYYKYSPPMANYIAEHNSLRAVTRIGLTPLVGFSFLAINYGMLVALAVLFSMLTMVTGGVCLAVRKNRAR